MSQENCGQRALFVAMLVTTHLIKPILKITRQINGFYHFSTASRPKRKAAKRKQRHGRSPGAANTEPVSYDQYQLRRSREGKKGVAFDVMTRGPNQNWPNNDQIDVTAREATNDQSLIEVNGVTSDGLKHYVTQSESMSNSVTLHATPRGLMNRNVSVTQSTLYSNTHDMLLQKVFLGQNPSKPRDSPYCPNFDTSIKYCMSQPGYYSNTVFQLEHPPIDDNFVRVSGSWPNQCYPGDGADRSSIAQPVLGYDPSYGSQPCLPRISLQEINSVFLACNESAACVSQGEMGFLSAPGDTDALAAITHSPTFGNDYEEIGSDPFFESPDCQGMSTLSKFHFPTSW